MQYAASRAKHVQFESSTTIEFSDTKIDAELITILRDQMGVSQLFEMQHKVFAHINTLSIRRVSGDVVLCAPTGSGKTLAYALPIVQALRQRTIARLRAIVIVPTRDLAFQVMRVFKVLTSTSKLTVGIAVGSSQIAEESRIVCGCEILIATPGRFVDHVENNVNLSLRHVRYLVMDESDRLLQESYQSWIEKVVPILGDPNFGKTFAHDDDEAYQRPGSGKLALALVPEVAAKCGSIFSGNSNEQVRKILVSATQTKNPMRLHALDLREPVFFEPLSTAVKGKDDQLGNSEDIDDAILMVPGKMDERGWVVKSISEKPTGLLVILGWVQPDTAHRKPKDQGNYAFSLSGTKLVFTNSVESAHRLCRLLELCAFLLKKKGKVLEMSGELSAERRQQVLKTMDSTLGQESRMEPENDFLVIVCSDLLARGMDMIQVDTVINYDAPAHINTYLHRAGRTARAGRSGTVFTLLAANQVRHFRQMVFKVDRGERKAIIKDLSARLREHSEGSQSLPIALQSLRRVLLREKLALVSSALPLQECVMYDLSQTHMNSVSGTKDRRTDSQVEDPIDAEYGNTDMGRKRKRGAEDQAVYYNDNEDNGPDEKEGEETDVLVNDGMSDILFSQIARNLLGAGLMQS